MDIASRIRRQREFLEFLIEKLQHPDPYQGRCYFCDKEIDKKSFNLGGDDQDNLTIHHVDESGTAIHVNNHIDNRVVIHKACHQEMHKLADKLTVPAMVVREMIAKERVKKNVGTTPEVSRG
jgi:hypothetical protein